MDDPTALALCGFQEANLEPDDGLAAVCRVVLNRVRIPYQSHGTIQSAIFWPNAFSWTQYEMLNGHYTKVAFTPDEIAGRAADLLARAKFYTRAWQRAVRISGAVLAGTYEGSEYANVTDDTVLYLNEAITHPLPSWADPAKQVCVIGKSTFFRA